MPNTLLTTTEAAQLLEVSDETIRRWVDADQIRYIRLPSGHLRFERTDIEAIRTPNGPAAP